MSRRGTAGAWHRGGRGAGGREGGGGQAGKHGTHALLSVLLQVQMRTFENSAQRGGVLLVRPRRTQHTYTYIHTTQNICPACKRRRLLPLLAWEYISPRCFRCAWIRMSSGLRSLAARRPSSALNAYVHVIISFTLTGSTMLLMVTAGSSTNSDGCCACLGRLGGVRKRRQQWRQRRQRQEGGQGRGRRRKSKQEAEGRRRGKKGSRKRTKGGGRERGRWEGEKEEDRLLLTTKL